MRDATSVLDRTLAISPHHAGAVSIMAVVEYYRASWGELPFEVAINRLDGVIARAPDYPLGHTHRGIALAFANRPEEALESLDAALRLAPQIPLCHGMRGSHYVNLGRLEEAEAEERWFETAQTAGIADSFSRSLISFARGDLDRAFDLLDEALRERAFFLPFVRLTARFHPLWDHPRFRHLVDQLWPGEQARVLGELGWRP
jgi:tetratricopeptide (TPR) repeat protein